MIETRLMKLDRQRHHKEDRYDHYSLRCFSFGPLKKKEKGDVELISQLSHNSDSVGIMG